MKNIILLIFGLFFCTLLIAQGLDTSFNHTGKVTVTVQQATSNFSLAVQPADQKILVGGMSGDGMFWSFCVVRYLPNGTPDPLFGNAGTVVIPFGVQTHGVEAIAIQPKDNKILLAGIVNETEDFPIATVIRLLPNGTLDPSFGSGGIAQVQAPTTVTGLGLQSDGSVVLAGSYGLSYCVTRLTSLGKLDTQFGTNGLATFFFSGGATCAGLGIIGQDEIVLSGTGGTKHAVTVCYTKNGTIDTHFGTNGVADVTVNGGKDPLSINCINVTSDGFILLAGNYLPAGSTHQSFLVIELLYDGVLDPSFAGNGKLAIPYTGADVIATGIAQSSYGIMVGGQISTSPGKFALCRATFAGAHDMRFGVNGWVLTGFPGGDAWGSAVAVQADNRIVQAGSVSADVAEGGMAVARFTESVVLPTLPPVDASGNPPVSGSAAGLSNAGEPHIFPNPASTVLHISGLDPDHPAMLNVIDASGRTVLKARSDGDSYSLDIHQLTRGMYYLQIITDTTTRSFPFLKSN